ncbi:MAG: ATP-binding protein, partial [Verrucomicrobiota bacterium]
MSQLHTARDFDADADNRQILQDERGVIYVANSKGLIEYDGARWKKVDREGIADVLCLTLGPRGRVFLGSFRDFGFLEADESGDYRFVSLKEKVPDAARDDQMYDRIFSDERCVYVQTDGNLYIWDCESQEMEVVSGLAGDSIVFSVGGEVYATFRNEAVKVLREGAWLTIDGFGFLSGTNGRVKGVAKGERGEVYLATSFMGIYRFDGNSLEVFSEDSSFMEQWRNVNAVEVLSGGRLAVGTNLSGLWVFDSDGSLHRHYERRDGLSDAMVKDIMEDRQRGVWLVQEKGIVRLQAPSPMTLYGEMHGIEGSIYFVEQREGILYLATASGAYASLSEEDEEGRVFRRIPGVAECKSLVSTEEGVIVGGSFSLYIVDGYKSEVIRDGWDASYLLRLKSNPSIILVAGYPGCGWLELVEGKWTFRGMIEQMDGKPVHGLVEDARGDVWFKSGEGITRRMTFEGTASKVETFDQEDGMLSGWVSPLRVKDAVLLTNADGRLLELDRETNRFEPSENFEYFPEEELRGFIEFVRDPEGVDWVSRSIGLGELIPRPVGWYALGMRSLSTMNDVRASGLYIEDEGIVWVSVYDGLVRFDASLEFEFEDKLVASVRAVEGLKGGKTIYGGDTEDEGFVLDLGDDSRSVRVEVASNSYWDTTRLEYRIFLEGVEEHFPWFSDESSKTYTNIPYGEYTLWVEVRDALGRRSEPRSMAVVVTSPWYRTKIAYGCYFLLVGGFLYLIARYWCRKFHRRNEQLRKQVEERTRDLAKKSKELEQHNFVLELRNDELKELARRASDAAEAKSRFLAMMSHEIRTPMNGVMGMCALMGNTELSKEQLDFLDSIKASSDALLNIIDDILDYTKFEEGRLELEMISFDIIECVESVVTLLGPQATSRDIELYLKIDDGVRNWRLSDPTRMRQVLVNLIGNALKFTSKGYIAVSLSECNRKSERSFLKFKVRDTGIGIEKEKLEMIFDPFSQADVSNVRRFGGTGLGLAICKHIIDRMSGEISVESELGLGS